MKLFDFLKMSECDYDTYDTEYDATVTVCCIYEEDEQDDYDKFCNEIVKKVDVMGVDTDSLTVNWSELINRNIDKFKKFTKKYWHKSCQYEDDIDEFIYQWINEIHMYLAGYVSEDFYKKLNVLVNSLV